MVSQQNQTPPASPLTPRQPAMMNIHASATNPASGASRVGKHCSSMYIRTQNLSYNYKRVPIGVLDWSPSDVSLTGVNIGGTVNNTVLIVAVWATTEAYVLSGHCWETSAYTQRQRFLIESASEIDGISYGAIGAGCMGPQGNTFNPASGEYYHREVYTGSGQPTWDPEVRVGYNFAIVDISGQATCSEDTYPNQQPGNWWGTDRHFDLATQLGENPTLCGGVIPKMDAWLGNKSGAYITTQDSIYDVQSVTDEIGAKIRDGDWVSHHNNNLGSCHYDPNLHYWGQ